MKKRFFVVCFAIVMCANLFSGCGASEDKKETNTVSTTSKAEESNKTDANSLDYSKYFENNTIPSDNMTLTMNTEDGKKFMAVSKAGENSLINIEAESSKVDVYLIGTEMYCHSVEENSDEWSKATMDDADEGFTVTDTYTADFDASKVSSVEYVEEVVEDNVTYDVISAKINDEEATELSDGVTLENIEGSDDVSIATNEDKTFVFYIERESQKISKVKYSASGMTLVMVIEECKSIELPKEATSAQEITSNDMGGKIMGAIFMAISNVVDFSALGE